MHIPNEAAEEIEGNRPTTNWPAVGKVEIQDLQVKFNSFNLKSKEGSYIYWENLFENRLDIGPMHHLFFVG